MGVKFTVFVAMNMEKDAVRIDVEAIADYPGYSLKRIKPKYDKNVVEIQQRLVELGYDVGISGIDGYFGKDTEKAVRNFQENMKILIDGVVGEVTWEKLFKYPQ